MLLASVGEDLADDEGTYLLIAGVAPGDLAAEIVDTARQHTEETGEHKNYRVVVYRSGPEDPDGLPQEAFAFGLPASMFSAPDELRGGDPSRDQHDAMLAMVEQFAQQNDTQFRMLMDVVRQYPVMLGRCSMLMEQLGDQLGGGRQHDVQQMLGILEFESRREERWMAHDGAKQRAGHRADLLAKSIDVAGPDLMQAVREGLQRMAGGSTENSTEREEGSGSTSSSSLAAKLDTVLGSVSEAGMARARELLTNDEWRLLEAARQAESDEELLALLGSLRSIMAQRGEDEIASLERELIVALGPEAALALRRFLSLVDERQVH
ncbi:MAG: hypothetical protein AB1Z98_13035 [Nannocystaceae bacterium]